MTTFGAMKTRILDEYINESLTTTQVEQAIQSAIAHYQRERFYFTEARNETFSTVNGQEFYGSADNANIPNLSLIDELTITVNSLRYLLEERSWHWIDMMSTTTTSKSEPTDFCYYAQQIRLYPIPDASYTVRISGLIRLPTLSSPIDTNAWMTDGEEMIRGRAKWDLATNILLAPDLAGVAQDMERTAYKVIKDETLRRGVSGRIRSFA